MYTGFREPSHQQRECENDHFGSMRYSILVKDVTRATAFILTLEDSVTHLMYNQQ